MGVHCVPSTSDEFAPASWYAAQLSGATELEAVEEETDHRVVWGLRAGAKDVGFEFKGAKVRASVRAETSVGLRNRPSRLCELALAGLDSGAADAFLRKAADEYSKHFNRKGTTVYYTRKVDEEVFWATYGTLPRRSVQSVFLSDHLEEELLSDVRRFLGDKAAYLRAGRPYKRVYCLHGPPGTGKTSAVMAVAGELKRNLAIFNVDSLRDDTFIELLSTRPDDAVLLFEDVDSLFKQRKDLKDTGMSFSTMLNSLDGILHPSGAIVFLTTNHLESLDEALRRPGRVDRLVEVPHSVPEQRARMWSAVFPNAPVPAVLVSPLKRVPTALVSEILFANRERNPAEMEAILRKQLVPETKQT